jgi:DNA-binding MarR family transcriptional regulator
MTNEPYRRINQFSELANPTRREIFFEIQKRGSINFNSLSRVLKLKKGLLAYHLASLCESGLVKRSKSKKNNINVIYALTRDGRDLFEKIDKPDDGIHPVSKDLCDIADNEFIKGDGSEAIKLYDISVKLSPDYGRAIFNRAVCIYSSQKSDRIGEALDDLERLDEREERKNSDVPGLKALLKSLNKDTEKNVLIDLWGQYNSRNENKNKYWDKVAKMNLKSLAPPVVLVKKRVLRTIPENLAEN